MSGARADRLAGKRAIVTGAAMGLGQASAVAMAEEGAELILFDRDSAGLEETALKIRAIGGSARIRVLDLTAEAEIVRAFAEMRDIAGPFDILLNNVGGSARERAREFWESSSDVWRDVIDVSLMPTLYCSRGKWWRRCVNAKAVRSSTLHPTRRSLATPGIATTPRPRRESSASRAV